jgi:hypothetical protein
MYIRLISSLLLLFSAFMNVKHGWEGFNSQPGDTGPVSRSSAYIEFKGDHFKSLFSSYYCRGIFITATSNFSGWKSPEHRSVFISNYSFLIVGDVKHALSELPFLLIPVILIFLEHPLAAK